MLPFDLNCDLGEGLPNDHLILPYITSANTACGYHAGNAEIMKVLVDLCLESGVLIGAHPSYPDKENFGRKDLIDVSLKPEDLPAIIYEQLSALDKICKDAGTCIHHVKPHGALYNRAAWDECVAGFICTALLEFDPSLVLYGLSNSGVMRAAKDVGLKFMNEVFADRTYQDDGSLTPRSLPDALILNVDNCIGQVSQMVNDQTVLSMNGKLIHIIPDTICIHGDGKHAVEFVKAIGATFQNMGK